MLWALLASLASGAFAAWGWASERRIRNQIAKALVVIESALEVERESYRQLVSVFNQRTVGASLKHKTERIPPSGTQ